jgi:uncharacterized membrane protein
VLRCRERAARRRATRTRAGLDGGPEAAIRNTVMGATMGKGRIEAFSDGVLAIIITIMVLEMHVPRGETLAALTQLWPVFTCYVLSFIYVGIYWNNHHHLMHAATHVTAGMLWANLHLLFWLSLFPFATGWMGENQFAPIPSAVYGVVLLMAALAWFILQREIVRSQGADSLLRRALGADWKGKLSPVLYVAGIVAAFCVPGLAQAMYLVAALVWLVPDRRIERALSRGERTS